MRGWTAAAIIALCTTLAGCFSSEAPLYTEADAACPFTEAATFGTPAIDRDGAIAHTAAFTVTPDGAYCVQRVSYAGTTDGQSRRLLFTRLERGWYVVQEQRDNQRYYYGLAHIDGARMSSYQPNCGDFTQEALSDAGIGSPFASLMSETPAETEPGEPARPSPPPKPRPGAPPPPPEPDPDPPDDGSCAVTSRAQLESLLRPWMRLGRPAESYADRMP